MSRLVRPRDVQRALGRTLRVRVAGPDSAARGREIWGAPGPRWFTPDDAIWQVHQHAAMFPGGVCALLLQSLHPAAMAGVAGHSGYKSDPWGRLQRTSDYLAVTTYGTTDQAEATIAKVRGIHDRVRGKDHRGRPYRAGDPVLLRWVQIAETYSFLTAHQHYARVPLSPAKADEYVAQTSGVGARLGATGLPRTVAELDEALTAFRPSLEASPAALDTARFLLWHPPLPWVARPGYGMIAAGGVALLPRWAARMLRLEVPGGRAAARPVGTAAVRLVGWALDGERTDREAGHRLTVG